jgi:hypothetical protein
MARAFSCAVAFSYLASVQAYSSMPYVHKNQICTSALAAAETLAPQDDLFALMVQSPLCAQACSRAKGFLNAATAKCNKVKFCLSCDDNPQTETDVFYAESITQEMMRRTAAPSATISSKGSYNATAVVVNCPAGYGVLNGIPSLPRGDALCSIMAVSIEAGNATVGVTGGKCANVGGGDSFGNGVFDGYAWDNPHCSEEAESYSLIDEPSLPWHRRDGRVDTYRTPYNQNHIEIACDALNCGDGPWANQGVNQEVQYACPKPLCDYDPSCIGLLFVQRDWPCGTWIHDCYAVKSWGGQTHRMTICANSGGGTGFMRKLPPTPPRPPPRS